MSQVSHSNPHMKHEEGGPRPWQLMRQEEVGCGSSQQILLSFVKPSLSLFLSLSLSLAHGLHELGGYLFGIGSNTGPKYRTSGSVAEAPDSRKQLHRPRERPRQGN